MLTQLRSELIKITSTRTIYGLGAGAVAVLALSTFSTISSVEPGGLDGQVHTQQFFLLASVNLAVFAVIVGIRAMTDEFRHGTVVSSVLSTRHRGRLLAAKGTVAAAAAAVIAVIAQAGMLGLALLVAGDSSALRVSTADWSAMAGLTAASAVWGALGVGVGALVRHQVAAIVGAVIWVLIVENLGAGLLGTAGRFLPGQAAHALARLPDQLSATTAAAVLAGYLATVLFGAHVSFTRRDL